MSRNKRETNYTHRTRSRNSSLADLVTHSEHTITSSQATVYTHNSQRNHYTQSLESWEGFENFEDIIGQESETLRISPEEERRIQSILELARKGVRFV